MKMVAHMTSFATSIVGVLFALTNLPNAQAILINTRLGPITGVSRGQPAVSIFYNIPFAQPPVGSLRFAKPVPYGSWVGTLNATAPGSQCMQTPDSAPVGTSEDCLYLNVYVPDSVNASERTSVMVWIHGGGFTSGAAYQYDAQELARQGNVVVVTIQYRLNIFGFFSLGSGEAPGNYGLWDQMLALKWVHQNIDSFGGDPRSVTIFGESAGGVSVSLMALIPENKDMFHRVIAQSGTMAVPWATMNSTQFSYDIGELSGCSKTLDTTAFLGCLRNIDAETLGNNTQQYTLRTGNAMVGPVVDGDLIKASPVNLLENSSSAEYQFFTSLDYMTGTMKSEGNILLISFTENVQIFYGLNLTLGLTPDQFCKAFVPFTSSNNPEVSRILCEGYRVENNMWEQARRMIDLLTEGQFDYGAFLSLRAHSRQNLVSSTYHYVFELDGKSILLHPPPPWYVGPGHADELLYLFPTEPLTGIYKNTSESLIKYWTSFAKNGDPDHSTLPHWPAYNNADEGFLRFGESIETDIKYKTKEMKFWDEKISRVLDEWHPLVKTASGEIRGITKYMGTTPGEGPVSVFYNIPYAAPPIGKLRFAKPSPFGNWSGTRDATRPGPECLQANMTSFKKSEDCLQLNIFVPSPVSQSSKKAVMVWIHGGGFLLGSGVMYDGSYLAHHGDVIVVTINYRLGIFGFFSLNDPVGRGNYGLWDQILALQWVQQNIAAFGGDPSSVTIFGESAGAFSVSLLSLIPSNHGLFHRVISQSGVAASRWAFGDSEPATKSVGDLAGCSRSLRSDLYLNCMRNVDANTLHLTQMGYIYRDPATIRQILEFTPGLDGELFKNTPQYILSSPSSPEHEFFSSLDFISGTVKTEGSNLAGTIIQEAVQNKFNINSSVGIPTEFMCDNFTTTLVADYFDGNKKVAELICEKYTVQNNLTEQGRKLLDIFTDFLFVAPSYVQLRSHSLRNVRAKSFQFVLERQKKTPDPYASFFPPWYSPPGHTEDLYYLFIKTELFLLTDPADIQYSRVIMSYWANFAKYGDPNEPSQPFWPTFDATKQAYLVFGDDVTAKMKYEEQRVKVWVEDIPLVMGPASHAEVVVRTPLGNIRGLTRDVPEVPGSRVFVFYAIPFAKPPLGDLRFTKPQPYGNFSDTFNATKMGGGCLQPPGYTNIPSHSEDCLQLNIYVPINISTANLKSVMVWIHGGGYIVGSAVQTDGSILATKGDVIVVTVNYRLGVFGFLSLNDAVSRGNYGIWDQILALQWVKDNIRSFGGNPDSITIFGESAGGFSVSLLSLIPQNQGLFHRVIAQSGAALCPLAFGDSRPGTIDVGKRSQCEHNSDSDAFVRCMRNKPAQELLKNHISYLMRDPSRFALVNNFMPYIDNELFHRTPSEILKNISLNEFKFFSSLDLMSGVVRQEGSLLFEMLSAHIQDIYHFKLNDGIPTEFVCNYFIPAYIHSYSVPGNQQVLKSAVCEQYRDTSSEGKQAEKAFDFFADFFFTVPMIEILNAHSTDNVRGRTFQYLLMEKYPYPYYTTPAWYTGPGHEEDVGFIFQYSTPPTDNITEYLAVSDKMIAYWSNFAKNGDPNSKSLERWPAYNQVTRGYIILDRGTNADIRYADSRVMFWLEKLPNKLNYQPTTTPRNPYVRDKATKIGPGSESAVLIVLLFSLIKIYFAIQ